MFLISSILSFSDFDKFLHLFYANNLFGNDNKMGKEEGMSNKNEQERKRAEREVKEIRSLVDEGLESGLFLEEDTTYIFTKWASRDFGREFNKYCSAKGYTAALNMVKGSSRAFRNLHESPELGTDGSQYGKGILTLDLKQMGIDCMMYYMPTEKEQVIIVRFLMRYS